MRNHSLADVRLRFLTVRCSPFPVRQSEGSVFTLAVPGHLLFLEATGVFISTPLRGDSQLEEISVN